MKNTKKLTLSALLLAIGIILPFFTGQIPQIGNMLLPMHIPVLICGYICGGKYGGLIGFMLPLFRSVCFGRPLMMPTGIAMAFELATYGIIVGILYENFKKTKIGLYISLISSMVIGRIVWGIVSYLLFQLMGNRFTWELFIAGVFLEAIPGLILQIIFVPAVVMRLQKTRILEMVRQNSSYVKYNK
ncbi:MAG: ECF transporter S component [Lachnospiraceae bacterium]|nr:ECF transporter S component [Lachnospiraceae bacterium]